MLHVAVADTGSVLLWRRLRYVAIALLLRPRQGSGVL